MGQAEAPKAPEISPLHGHCLHLLSVSTPCLASGLVRPPGSPGAPECLALTQSPSLLQSLLRRTLSREALGPSPEEAEDWLR